MTTTMLKNEYTHEEWKVKEQYYIDALMGMVIPKQPNSKEIMEFTTQLDQLYTEASFDYANVSRALEIVSLDLKNAEAELFTTIKKQQLAANTKITENDVKGLVKTYIGTNKLKGYQSDLYSVVKYYMDKHIFIQQVVKTISEKKNSLITDTAMLKIENSFTGAKEPGR